MNPLRRNPLRYFMITYKRLRTESVRAHMITSLVKKFIVKIAERCRTVTGR